MEKLFRVSQPVNGIAAWRDGRSEAASKVPPPPIECPTTPVRLLSIRLATDERVVR